MKYLIHSPLYWFRRKQYKTAFIIYGANVLVCLTTLIVLSKILSRQEEREEW